jgi:hypothetical protein
MNRVAVWFPMQSDVLIMFLLPVIIEYDMVTTGNKFSMLKDRSTVCVKA